MSNQILCDGFIIAGLFYFGLCLCLIGRPSLVLAFLQRIPEGTGAKGSWGPTEPKLRLALFVVLMPLATMKFHPA